MGKVYRRGRAVVSIADFICQSISADGWKVADRDTWLSWTAVLYVAFLQVGGKLVQRASSPICQLAFLFSGFQPLARRSAHLLCALPHGLFPVLETSNISSVRWGVQDRERW